VALQLFDSDTIILATYYYYYYKGFDPIIPLPVGESGPLSNTRFHGGQLRVPAKWHLIPSMALAECDR